MSPAATASPRGCCSWTRRRLEGGFQAVAADESVVGSSKVRDLEKRVQQLERPLGRKTLKNEILKGEAAERTHREQARPKKPLLRLSSWDEDGSR
jgi:transposase